MGAVPQAYGPAFDDPSSDDLVGYLATGNLPSVLSGRVAYTFGLRGPL